VPFQGLFSPSGSDGAGPARFPCSKLKLDQLFLQWLSLPESNSLVSPRLLPCDPALMPKNESKLPQLINKSLLQPPPTGSNAAGGRKAGKADSRAVSFLPPPPVTPVTLYPKRVVHGALAPVTSGLPCFPYYVTPFLNALRSSSSQSFSRSRLSVLQMEA
jgi:hypothetical protein